MNNSQKLSKDYINSKSGIISSVPEGTESFILSDMLKSSDSNIIYVAMDDAKLARIEQTIKCFFPDIEVLTFPAWDCIPYDRVSPHQNIVSQRIRTLKKILEKSEESAKSKKSAKPYILLTTVNSVCQKVVPIENFINSVFTAKTGDLLERDDLVKFLIENGYNNTAAATEDGEFSLRGSIIDIVPTGEEIGYRLDFFDIELESIRLFNPITQISHDSVDSIEIVPASEVILNEKTISAFRKNYRELFGSASREDPLFEAISEGRKYAGMEHWLPLFYDNMGVITDYIDNRRIVYEHLVNDAYNERYSLVKDSYETRLLEADNGSKYGTTYFPIQPDSLYVNKEAWNDMIQSAISDLRIYPFEMPEKDGVVSAGFKQGRNYFAEGTKLENTALQLMIDDGKPKIEAGKGKRKTKSAIACMSKGSRSRIENMLSEYDCRTEIIDDWQNQDNVLNSKDVIGLIVLDIDKGYEVGDIQIISEEDILGEKIFRSSTKRQKKAENFLNEASHLVEGELVVHKQHGIGRFEGLETIEVSSVLHDFILLIYHGGDKLFVPVENIDILSRYGGSEESTQLDKLGNVAWQQRTSKIRNKIKIAAEELIEVAAKRAKRKGRVFYASGGLYEEFCARFPYSETEDQLNAINDVIEDLQSGQPMDRLVCGDVGFGKTEVALRAAFIVAHNPENDDSDHDDGKSTPYKKGQVAVIAPTTLLCRQHYKEFTKRFAGMGIEIRQISRLVSPKEIKETKELLAEGEIDIVIGTHALLSKDVKFKNLSLVVVDEEQRFGVAQKEKLKKLQTNSHILTLTATPIPRTLQLSMSGIRELSLISTPPVDRLAVRTYIMPFDAMIIRDAILREHYRGGRSYFVCPRIKDIEEMHEKLKELVPEVKIVIAHGQMKGEELDKIMTAFDDGVYDLLLCTTIIESGIDISAANTMIIHRADMYGLAQLYQIRGRVGRSKVRAYAYLTLPPKKIPTKQAVKRLEVMQKLDNLGAGFMLASHDMDIRGFGNLLGDEQSGNIKEVGVELYQSMLREAIKSLKEDVDAEDDGLLSASNQDFMPKININSSVLIPEGYIADLSLRMGLYRRIANIETDMEVEAIASELEDRFGSIPEEVENLLSIVKIKRLCMLAGIEKLDIGKKGAGITFFKNSFHKPDALIQYISANAGKIKIKKDYKLSIISKKEFKNNDESMKWVSKELNKILEL